MYKESDLKIIHETELCYEREIRDFEKYWYLGKRFQYIPFAGYVNASFTSETLNFNSMGFRGGEFTKKNVLGGIRVGIFGASGLVGIPVANDDNNISSYVNRYFSENNYNAKSLNFGVISARIGNEFRLISRVLAEFDIDCIVLLSGFNDGSTYTLGSLWEYQDISDIQEAGFEANSNLSNPPYFFKKFLEAMKRKAEMRFAKKESGKTFRGAEKYFRRKRAKIIDKTQHVPIFESGERVYLQFLNQILNVCKFRNIPFIYIFQPSLLTTNKKLSKYEISAHRSQNNIFGQEKTKQQFLIEQFKGFYMPFGKKCQLLVTENKGHIIQAEDNFSSVNSKNNIFYDEAHYFELGNKLIGDSIAKLVMKII